MEEFYGNNFWLLFHFQLFSSSGVNVLISSSLFEITIKIKVVTGQCTELKRKEKKRKPQKIIKVLKGAYFKFRITQGSAASCDLFGCRSEWKKIKATNIITKVAKLASVLSVK